MNETKIRPIGDGIIGTGEFSQENTTHKVNEKQRKIDQNAIIDELDKLKNSDNEEDKQLLELVEKEFQAKIDKFQKQIEGLPRGMRRRFIKNNTFSKNLKRRIGL